MFVLEAGGGEGGERCWAQLLDCVVRKPGEVGVGGGWSYMENWVKTERQVSCFYWDEKNFICRSLYAETIT